MGLIARLLSFTRTERNGAKVSDVKADPGGGPNITMEHFSAPGDDSFPLSTDYITAIDQAGGKRWTAVGYHDPLNAPKALEGEKRIYSRDSAGAVVAEIWLKNGGAVTVVNAAGSFTLSPAGSILVTNGGGSYELQAGGDFVVNGVTIDTNGNISTSGTVNADEVIADNIDVTLSTHTHGTGPAPNPGT